MLHDIFIAPFADMIAAPDFLMQVLWEGLVSGILYALIALGFVLIYRSSRIFNFAQGIMVVFAALTLVGLHAMGVPAWISVVLTLAVMFGLAVAIERVVLRPLVGQPDIILFMATIGITLFLIGFGEIIFGGENKVMITEELGIPTGSWTLEPFGGLLILEQKDVTAVAVAAMLVVGLLGRFTTFSAFGWEVLELMREGRFGAVLGVVALNNLLGIGAVWGGWLIASPTDAG